MIAILECSLFSRAYFIDDFRTDCKKKTKHGDEAALEKPMPWSPPPQQSTKMAIDKNTKKEIYKALLV